MVASPSAYAGTDMDIHDGRHDLTLMKRTMMEWVRLADGHEPTEFDIRCQECGRRTLIEPALFNRGEYFCDGSQQVTYRPYREGVPGIGQVFSDMEIAHAQASEEELEDIVVALHELMERLDQWAYLHTHKE